MFLMSMRRSRWRAARGLFPANGIEVEVIVTPNSTEQMRGLGKGSWQIVSTAFDNVLGWSAREGAEIVAIAQVSQGIILPIYVRPEIKTWDDLRGKPASSGRSRYRLRIGSAACSLGPWTGMDRGDYELIPKGTTGYRLDSMTHGETFAGVLNPPWDAKAAAAGMVTNSRITARCCLIIPEAFLRSTANGRSENHALLVKFLRVWNQALGWAHDDSNRDEAHQAHRRRRKT